MRGNHILPRRALNVAGSIPACAGETELLNRWSEADSGLSPRVRGNPFRPNSCTNAVRSIPACAGKPRGGTAVKISGPVYPRVCGETVAATTMDVPAIGLSPRVRGNQCWWCSQEAVLRSIPACAGKPRLTE